jgi:hypothetical protein
LEQNQFFARAWVFKIISFSLDLSIRETNLFLASTLAKCAELLCNKCRDSIKISIDLVFEFIIAIAKSSELLMSKSLIAEQLGSLRGSVSVIAWNALNFLSSMQSRSLNVRSLADTYLVISPSKPILQSMLVLLGAGLIQVSHLDCFFSIIFHKSQFMEYFQRIAPDHLAKRRKIETPNESMPKLFTCLSELLETCTHSSSSHYLCRGIFLLDSICIERFLEAWSTIFGNSQEQEESDDEDEQDDDEKNSSKVLAKASRSEKALLEYRNKCKFFLMLFEMTSCSLQKILSNEDIKSRALDVMEGLAKVASTASEHNLYHRNLDEDKSQVTSLRTSFSRLFELDLPISSHLSDFLGFFCDIEYLLVEENLEKIVLILWKQRDLLNQCKFPLKKVAQSFCKINQFNSVVQAFMHALVQKDHLPLLSFSDLVGPSSGWISDIASSQFSALWETFSLFLVKEDFEHGIEIFALSFSEFILSIRLDNFNCPELLEKSMALTKFIKERKSKVRHSSSKAALSLLRLINAYFQTLCNEYFEPLEAETYSEFLKDLLSSKGILSAGKYLSRENSEFTRRGSIIFYRTLALLVRPIMMYPANRFQQMTSFAVQTFSTLLSLPSVDLENEIDVNHSLAALSRIASDSDLEILAKALVQSFVLKSRVSCSIVFSSWFWEETRLALKFSDLLLQSQNTSFDCISAFYSMISEKTMSFEKFLDLIDESHDGFSETKMIQILRAQFPKLKSKHVMGLCKHLVPWLFNCSNLADLLVPEHPFPSQFLAIVFTRFASSLEKNKIRIRSPSSAELIELMSDAQMKSRLEEFLKQIVVELRVSSVQSKASNAFIKDILQHLGADVNLWIKYCHAESLSMFESLSHSIRALSLLGITSQLDQGKLRRFLDEVSEMMSEEGKVKIALGQFVIALGETKWIDSELMKALLKSSFIPLLLVDSFTGLEALTSICLQLLDQTELVEWFGALWTSDAPFSRKLRVYSQILQEEHNEKLLPLGRTLGAQAASELCRHVSISLELREDMLHFASELLGRTRLVSMSTAMVSSLILFASSCFSRQVSVACLSAISKCLLNMARFREAQMIRLAALFLKLLKELLRKALVDEKTASLLSGDILRVSQEISRGSKKQSLGHLIRYFLTDYILTLDSVSMGVTTKKDYILISYHLFDMTDWKS